MGDKEGSGKRRVRWRRGEMEGDEATKYQVLEYFVAGPRAPGRSLPSPGISDGSKVGRTQERKNARTTKEKSLLIEYSKHLFISVTIRRCCSRASIELKAVCQAKSTSYILSHV
jgi:hypothetical protein